LDFDLSSQITPLGYHLAALPISPRIGKLILYGVLLKCIDPILTIASMLSAKSPFVVPFNERDAADAAKLSFMEGNSDLLTMLNGYRTWKEMFGGDQATGSSGGGSLNNRPLQSSLKRDEEDFCRRKYLSLNNLKLIVQMRGQFLSLLQSIGFLTETLTLDNIVSSSENEYGSNIAIIKCAICAGLSPSILMCPPESGQEKAPKNSGAMSKRLFEIPLLTRRSQVNMFIHPSSILGDARFLDHRFLVYVEAVKTSKIYAREATTVPSLLLCLFSGRLDGNERLSRLVVDGWIHFSCHSGRTIRCLLKVKDAMEDAFLDKVMDPMSPLSEKWQQILRVLARVLVP
jgi:HrpA-like RNA helicase